MSMKPYNLGVEPAGTLRLDLPPGCTGLGPPQRLGGQTLTLAARRAQPVTWGDCSPQWFSKATLHHVLRCSAQYM